MSSVDKKRLMTMNAHDYNSGNFDKAILAIGSTESHGEHLPYGTDTFVAEHLANAVAKRIKGLIVLPTIPIGMSEHYASFPIAISLTTQTLINVISDVLESLYSHDILKLLIVNGHDGNISAIEAATREFRISHPEMKIAVLEAWWITAGELLPNDLFEAWGGLGHGGEGETSMMLAVAPELVCMERAKGVIPQLPDHIQLKWIFHELTPYGVTGDPTKASFTKGKMMEDVLVDSLVSFLNKMEDHDWSITYS